MLNGRKNLKKINLRKYLEALRTQYLNTFLELFDQFDEILSEETKIITIAEQLIESGFNIKEDFKYLQRLMALLAYLDIPKTFNKNHHQQYFAHLLLRKLYIHLSEKLKTDNTEYNKTTEELNKNPTIGTEILSPDTLRELHIKRVNVDDSPEIKEKKRKSYIAIVGSTKQPINKDLKSKDEKEDDKKDESADKKDLTVTLKPNLPSNNNLSNKKFIIAGAVILAFVAAASVAAVILTGPGAALLTPLFLMAGNAVLTTLSISASTATSYTVGAVLLSTAVVAVASALGALMGYMLGKIYHRHITPKKSLAKIEAPDSRDSNPPSPTQTTRKPKPHAEVKKQETPAITVPHDSKANQPSSNRAALYGYGSPVNTNPQSVQPQLEPPSP